MESFKCRISLSFWFILIAVLTVMGLIVYDLNRAINSKINLTGCKFISKTGDTITLVDYNQESEFYTVKKQDTLAFMKLHEVHSLLK